MRVRARHILTAFLVAVVLPACAGRSRAAVQAGEPDGPVGFPSDPVAPSIITTPSGINEYVVSRFWDAFLEKTGKCDSTLVNGVPSGEVEAALARYISLLENVIAPGKAPGFVEAFFNKVNDFQIANPSSNVFSFFAEKVRYHLYDPNSHSRDEDLYLPYVEGLAASNLVDNAMREAYSAEVMLCSLNRKGTVAEDIVFTLLDGRRATLHGIKAGHTLLMFSNPGCDACDELTDRLASSEMVSRLVKSGDLAVVNLYIDLEVEKWAALAAKYPKTWLNGYDQDYTIRKDLTYSVRAIPSLYLLDKDKTVILKDAPVEKVLIYLENI